MFQSRIVTVFNIVWLFSKVWSVIILSSAFVIIQNFSQFQKRRKDEKIPELNFVIFQFLWQSNVFPKKYEEIYERRFEL